jgi:hypothetical protein
VGDTGPGGGKVFYVASTPFASPGSTCNTNGAGGISTCRYLEAAPNTWSGGSSDPTRSWATDINSNQSTAVTGADGTAIGTGYQNSLDIQNQGGNVAGTSAAVLARAYRGNDLTDWYLPSKVELNQMCKWQGGITGAALTNLTTVCTGGILNSGLGAAGFVLGGYWSSSESSANGAWIQNFNGGGQIQLYKNYPYYVRPVRAF